MQKPVYTCIWGSSEIFKTLVAFVAFVARRLKSPNAFDVGVISRETLATIILFRLILLLLLLPGRWSFGNTGNKLSYTGNKRKIHCCRTFAKYNAIAANGLAKQHGQQKHTLFEILWGGMSFSENQRGSELVEMGYFYE